MTNPFVALYAFWQTTPAPVQAALVSAAFTVNTALGLAFSIFSGSSYNNGTNGAFLAWLADHWIYVLFGTLYGAASASSFRSLQAAGKLPSNTVGPPPSLPSEAKGTP